MIINNRKVLLLFVLCCILAFPIVVRADEYNYQYVDYRFIMQDDAGKNIEGLHFKLYDESKLFQFDSKYNEEDNYYYFDVYTDDKDISSSIPQEIRQFSGADNSMPNSCDVFTSNFEEIVARYPTFSVGTKNCYYYDYDNYYAYSTYSVNRIIPLILEEESRNIIIIIFGYMHYSIDLGDKYYKFILINNKSFKNSCKIEESVYKNEGYSDLYTYSWNDIRCLFFYNIGLLNKNEYLSSGYANHATLSNYNEMLNNPGNHRVDGSLPFMRNTVYDYTDELWEQLNNGPIASSEMNMSNSSVLINNESTNLNEPSTILFNKKDNNMDDSNVDSNKKESIIKKITNPKTLTNGVLVLIISMIVIIGSSYVLIKKKS